MKVATEPYGKLEFNYPEVVLEPFKLNTANIQIIGDEEEQEKPEENANEANVSKTEINPQDVINSVKSSINQNVASPSQSVPSQISQPVSQKQPVQQLPKTTAPSPIPMAIPESLH